MQFHDVRILGANVRSPQVIMNIAHHFAELIGGPIGAYDYNPPVVVVPTWDGDFSWRLLLDDTPFALNVLIHGLWGERDIRH